MVTTIVTRIRRTVLAAGALGALLGACAEGGDGRGDTADRPPAPATVRDMSATVGAPDSTAGVSERSGRPGVAGDTVRGTARAAQARDTARRRP